jgi:hypothetical protein
MTGFIYAIESGDAVKIGFSQKPATREKNLRTGNPSCAEMIGFVAATVGQERELHNLISPARIRGEWFRRDNRLVQQFLTMLTPIKRPSIKYRTDCAGPAPFVIARFGGDTALARLLGVHRVRVANWKMQRSGTCKGGTGGRIPQRHHATILKLARDRGFAEITPEFMIFGIAAT